MLGAKCGLAGRVLKSQNSFPQFPMPLIVILFPLIESKSRVLVLAARGFHVEFRLSAPLAGTFPEARG